MSFSPIGVSLMQSETDRDEDLQRLADQGGLSSFWKRHQDRLVKMVQLRMDSRLSGRLDPEDVMQDAFIEAARRLDSYLQDPAVPIFIWLRRVTHQILMGIHRRHLGVAARSAAREAPVHAFDQSTVNLAEQKLGSVNSPSDCAARDELSGRVRDALDRMNPVDHEVLFLRHFEELTNTEVAHVLGLQKAAASNRYVRALSRLRATIQDLDYQ